MKQFLSILLISLFGILSTQAQSTVETPTSTYELPAKKRAIKMGLLAPLGNKLILGYEQWIKQKMTFEVKVGIIGIGFDVLDVNPKGAFVKFGPKFLAGQDFYIPGMKDVHPLRGTYFKPEIAISAYSRNAVANLSNERINDFSTALLMNLGKQWVLADIITIDAHIGLGYGWSNNGDADILDGNGLFFNKFSNVQGPNTFPIATTSGITIGILLK